MFKQKTMVPGARTPDTHRLASRETQLRQGRGSIKSKRLASASRWQYQHSVSSAPRACHVAGLSQHPPYQPVSGAVPGHSLGCSSVTATMAASLVSGAAPANAERLCRGEPR